MTAGSHRSGAGCAPSVAQRRSMYHPDCTAQHVAGAPRAGRKDARSGCFTPAGRDRLHVPECCDVPQTPAPSGRSPPVAPSVSGQAGVPSGQRVLAGGDTGNKAVHAGEHPHPNPAPGAQGEGLRDPDTRARCGVVAPGCHQRAPWRLPSPCASTQGEGLGVRVHAARPAGSSLPPPARATGGGVPACQPPAPPRVNSRAGQLQVVSTRAMDAAAHAQDKAASDLAAAPSRLRRGLASLRAGVSDQILRPHRPPVTRAVSLPGASRRSQRSIAHVDA